MNEVSIPCAGYNLSADWYERNNDKVLLIIHGFNSNKTKQSELTKALVAKTGCSALVIDLSGHSGVTNFSKEQITPAQNFLEVINSFDWINNKYPDKQIIVLGSSYGGFMAAQLLKYRKFQKLLLRAPALYRPYDFYTKLHEIERHDDRDEADWNDLVSGHPLLARSKLFNGKSLVIVHELDDLVPAKVTDAYIESFNSDKYLARGFRHSLSVHKPSPEQLEEYHENISNWITI